MPEKLTKYLFFSILMDFFLLLKVLAQIYVVKYVINFTI